MEEEKGERHEGENCLNQPRSVETIETLLSHDKYPRSHHVGPCGKLQLMLRLSIPALAQMAL